MYVLINGDTVVGISPTHSSGAAQVQMQLADGEDVPEIGSTYVNGVFTTPEPVSPPPPATDPTEWLIDIGPFFDRFGTSMMTVLTSADMQVQGLVTSIQVRKWIDLQRPDVAQGLTLLISKGLITTEQKTTILTTPVAAEESLALRKTYFS